MESEILLEIIEQIKELQSKFKLVNSNIKKLEKQHKKIYISYCTLY